MAPIQFVDSSWNAMAHGDARVGKWRGNWRMEWVASTLHTTSEHGVSSITTAGAHTSAASSRLNWRPPADLNGLVRFAERRSLFSARVPSHFNWPLPSREHYVIPLERPICQQSLFTFEYRTGHVVTPCGQKFSVLVTKLGSNYTTTRALKC